MKNMIKSILPDSFKERIVKSKIFNLYKLKNEYNKDYKKFKRFSYKFSVEKEKRHDESDLIFYYHKIEKGLSLPNPKVGFGKDNIKYLLNLLNEYIKKYGWDDISVISLNTLYEYYYFNKANNLSLNELYFELEKLKKTMPENVKKSMGGTIEITKKEIQSSLFDFEKFAYSRYSIRNFTNEVVSLDVIEKAVKIAQKTPSVCNRQSSKVYVYEKNNDKKKILSFQNGNKGFGHLADKILIVSVDLRDFRGPNERNQAYIDGGMFSMSLIYALHSLGVGTCPLNLSINNKVENELKKVAKIPESELLIMMIAVGHIPEKLKVAWSPRRNVYDVLKVIE